MEIPGADINVSAL